MRGRDLFKRKALLWSTLIQTTSDCCLCCPDRLHTGSSTLSGKQKKKNISSLHDERKKRRKALGGLTEERKEVVDRGGRRGEGKGGDGRLKEGRIERERK